MPTPNAIVHAVEQATESTVRLRRRLHAIPEIMYQEHETAAEIRRQLDALGVAWHAGPADAPTATFAYIGNPEHPCVALRADIDALPIEEATGVSYASTHPGMMHACGHDGHAAALVGAAAVLKRLEADLGVCILLIWQPAEENGGGAARVVASGVLDGAFGPRPRSIYALHGWPALSLGMIATKAGPIMASVDNFTATFHGVGAHGAFPHLGRDPIVAAAEGILALQQIVSREINPVDAAVITIGKISGGSSYNVIPPAATIEGTARALTPETRQYLGNAIERRLQGIAQSHDLRLELSWLDRYPPTVNDPQSADFVRDVTRRAFGPDAFITAAQPSMGGEDFAYYLEKIPGCFIIVGLQPAGVNDCPGLHHPKFNFNDDALPTAIRLLVELAINAQ